MVRDENKNEKKGFLNFLKVAEETDHKVANPEVEKPQEQEALDELFNENQHKI